MYPSLSLSCMLGLNELILYCELQVNCVEILQKL